jgi:hypothetical protein
MILNRDSANLGETLIDMHIAAVRRKEREANRRGVIDELQGGLLCERAVPEN